MTVLDDTLVPRAKAMCEKYGKAMTFTVQTDAYTPSTGRNVPTGVSTEVVKCVPPEGVAPGYVNGDTIKQSDLMTWVPAENLPFTPKLAQDVQFDGRCYQVTAIMPIYTGELVALYGLVLRGGGVVS